MAFLAVSTTIITAGVLAGAVALSLILLAIAVL